MTTQAPSTSSTTSPSFANVPPLPTELLEQILLEDVLKQRDLAACCLVSRRMRTVAEPHLYTKLTVKMGAGQWPDRPTGHDSFLWIDTVRASSRLAALVKVIVVRRLGSEPQDLLSTSPVALALAVCPNIDFIDCEVPLLLRHVDFPALYAAQSTLTCIDTLSLQDFPRDWNILLALPNLVELGLGLGACAGGPGEDAPRPEFRLEALRLLDIDAQGPGTGPDKSLFDALLHLSHDSLTDLEMRATRRMTTMINLEQFPNMKNLSLLGRWSGGRPNDDEVDAAVTLLRGCRTLHGLVLCPIVQSNVIDVWHGTMPVILAAVPPTLKRLELGRMPSVALVDEILGWLPRAVQLDQLGLVAPSFDLGRSNPKGCAAECAAIVAAGDGATAVACSCCARWAAEAQLWAALEVHCAAKGLDLVETELAIF
ncbi:hypothetical protein JCM8208_004449 [Rhodotorula glutinis]